MITEAEIRNRMSKPSVCARLAQAMADGNYDEVLDRELDKATQTVDDLAATAYAKFNHADSDAGTTTSETPTPPVAAADDEGGDDDEAEDEDAGNLDATDIYARWNSRP